MYEVWLAEWMTMTKTMMMMMMMMMKSAMMINVITAFFISEKADFPLSKVRLSFEGVSPSPVLLDFPLAEVDPPPPLPQWPTLPKGWSIFPS